VLRNDAVLMMDGVGLDRSQTLTETGSSLMQELERAGGTVVGSPAVGVRPVFLEQVSLRCGSDFVNRFEGLIDGPFLCRVVGHLPSIAQFGPAAWSRVSANSASRLWMVVRCRP
jgi:hypothetical protein